MGPPLELPHDITPQQLQILCNKIVKDLNAMERKKNRAKEAMEDEEEDTPYAFFVNEQEVVDTLAEIVDQQKLTSEQVRCVCERTCLPAYPLTFLCV